MKVGKTEQELGELKKNGVKDLSGFTPLKSKKPGKSGADPKKHPNFWTGYDFEAGSLDFRDKQRYEWFCAGFLLYYDDVVRSGGADHLIWFKWDEGRVGIYISPGPKRGKKNSFINSAGFASSDPPKPPPPPPPPLR